MPYEDPQGWLDATEPSGYVRTKKIEGIRPLHDNVLLEIEPDPPGAGILIIRQRRERVTFGKVLAVGPGAWIEKGPLRGKARKPMQLKVGDRVVVQARMAFAEVGDIRSEQVIVKEWQCEAYDRE